MFVSVRQDVDEKFKSYIFYAIYLDKQQMMYTVYIFKIYQLCNQSLIY